MNKISVADIIRCGACDARLSEMLNFLEKMNINSDSTIDIDEMISIYNNNGMRHFGYWLNQMRPKLLNFSDIDKVVYEVSGTSFNTLEEAQNATLVVKEDRLQLHRSHATVAFSEALDENHSWIPIDIDTFSIPETATEYHFHVFDHETGTHTEAYSIEEAKQHREAFITSMLLRDKHMWTIRKKTYFKEYAGSHTVETLE